MGCQSTFLRTLIKLTPKRQELPLNFLKERCVSLPNCFTSAPQKFIGEAERFGLQNKPLTKQDSLNSILADFTAADTIRISRTEKTEMEVLSSFKCDRRIQSNISQSHLENIKPDTLHSLQLGKFNNCTGERITHNKQAVIDCINQDGSAIDKNLRLAEKFKIMKGASWQTKVDLMKADADVKMFVTGNKPAVAIERYDNIRNIQSLTGENIDVITLSNSTVPMLLNRTLVKNIIEKNKSIYCQRLNCSESLTVEQIYEKLLETLGKKHNPGSIDDILGLTLGYPTKSTCIHHLRTFANNKYGTNFCWGYYQNASPAEIQEFKNILLKALKENDSPYANCSPKLIKELESMINQINGFSHSGNIIRNNESMYFITYLSEPQEFARIQNYVDSFNRLHI